MDQQSIKYSINKSTEEVGIQLADIIAGIFRDFFESDYMNEQIKDIIRVKFFTSKKIDGQDNRPTIRAFPYENATHDMEEKLLNKEDLQGYYSIPRL